MGDHLELSQADPVRQSASRRRLHAREWWALLLVLFGLPSIGGWLVSGLLLSSSRAWTAKQRAIGFLGPAVATVAILLVVWLVGGGGNSSCVVGLRPLHFLAVDIPALRGCTSNVWLGGLSFVFVVAARLAIVDYLFAAAKRPAD